MEEWVVLSLPGAVCLYGLALFFCLFEKRYHATKGFFSFLSAALVLCGTACNLLGGAALRECTAILTVFLLLNMEVRK